MGLQKSKVTNIGVAGNYWKITYMEVDWRARRLVCYLNLFLDKDTSDANYQPMQSISFTYEGDDFDYVSADDLVAKTYLKIKSPEDSWFHDAVDVFEEGQP